MHEGKSVLPRVKPLGLATSFYSIESASFFFNTLFSSLYLSLNLYTARRSLLSITSARTQYSQYLSLSPPISPAFAHSLLYELLLHGLSLGST